MRTFKARESRKSVNILVRIKSNGIWIDGCVHTNVEPGHTFVALAFEAWIDAMTAHNHRPVIIVGGGQLE